MKTATRSVSVSATRALAAALDERRASYNDVAEAVGCVKQLVGQIVHGQPTPLERAEAIAAYLGKPVGVLFRHKNGDPIGGA